MDSLKLELLKNKQEHAQSAIASQEVREHLAGFIRSKRQGSSGQINTIQVGHNHHHHQQLIKGSGGRNARTGSGSGGSGANNNYSSHYVANLINEGPQDDDHPLRKTASMPTMHIPYKAQSLSRRRQMERRTTMSPLMRRKSRPKRQLLHSHDSSSTEYSSNPCIIQSSRACARSLSQSSSPPPHQQQQQQQQQQLSTVQMDTCNDDDNDDHDRNAGIAQPQHPSVSPVTTNNLLTSSATATAAPANTANPISQSQTSDPTSTPTPTSSSSSQAIKLSSIFTNSELENLQNNLKNSLYFSAAKSHSSTTNIHLAASQQQKSTANQQAMANISKDSQLPLDQQHALMRQQQHLKVNEAIRKTVIQRASSRGRHMAGGGSLDIEGTLAASGGVGSDTAGPKGGPGHSTAASFGEETLRQWSLDGADLRTSAAMGKPAVGSSISGGGLFHRDFHKLRLATTKDAATLRRSQSPSSSISMGLSSGQAAASIAQLQQQQQQTGIIPTIPYARAISLGQHITNVNSKHYSSSSSSTSSLLSQQDSLEDSSSQAIDLSSSSEVSRRHHYHHPHPNHHQHHPHPPQSTSIFTPANAHSGARSQQQQQLQSQLLKSTNSIVTTGSNPPKQQATMANQQYQKVLQDSFNQLQLCNSQEGLNQFQFLPATKQPPVPSHHYQAVQRGDSSNATCQHYHHPPPLLDTSKMASSLDAANSHQHHQHPMGSLSEQFNLSASAQNLISLQDHHFHHNHHQQQQQQLQQSQVHLLQQHQRQQQQQQPHNSPISSQQQNPPQPANQIGPLMAHQQHDLNQLMLAYKNLIQSPDAAVGSQQQQQAGQISSSLLAKMTNLPETYRSSLISHLLQQQQQQQQQEQQFRTFNPVSEGPNASGGRLVSEDQSQAHHGYGHCQYHHHCQQAEQLHGQPDQRSLISRALSSPLLASRPTIGCQDHKSSLPVEAAYSQKDQMMCCDMVMGNLNDRVDTQLPLQQQQQQQEQANRLVSNFGELVAPEVGAEARVGEHPTPGDNGRDSASVMIIDTVDDGNLDKASKSKQFSIVENSSHSLDLTTSSRSGSVASGGCCGGGGGGVSEGGSGTSSGGNKSETALLNFNYTPRDPMKVSCSFIYNPIFDKTSSTGLIYELGMCNHKCICGDENNHPENSHRILAIWRRLYDVGLMTKCARIEGRRATLEEIQLCHSDTYSYYFGKGPYERLKISQLDLSKLPIEGLTQLECGGQGADIDTPWNEEQTPGVARLAAGCVIEAAVSVANGKLMNAFAIVRPPGHHAEFQQAMGFCFFNSVAIAARVLISKHQLARVLIVDWDVHHGNGIQKMFYEDKRVMYISLHRHDKGNFFPGTGDTKEVGSGPGEGFNWNIAWSGESMGDAEYLAAFRCLVMPIAIDYNPSMVLVACGFDAARGHPFNFGGYDLSPACFAYMTRQLMSLANGRLVLCLEGGYQLNTICDCAESCVRALLNESHLRQTDQVRESELRREPNQSASEVLFELSSLAAKYWPNVERWRSTIDRSALEAAATVAANVR